MINKVMIVFMTLFYGNSFASSRESLIKIQLPDPEPFAQMETPSRGVSNLFITKDTILTVPLEDKGFYESSFDPRQQIREKRFPPLAQIRQVLAKEKGLSGIWQSVHKEPYGFLMFDGVQLVIAKADTKGTIIEKHSLAWDFIRPPKDSRGEATDLETSKFRGNFKKNMEAKADQIKFVGLSEKSASEKNETVYFAGTRIKGFPIVEISCLKDEPAKCQTTRGCFVHLDKDFSPEDLTGIAFSKKDKKIFLATKNDHILRVLKYQSCYHVQLEAMIALPKKLKTLSGVFIDEEGHLWVSTFTPDDYANATIFSWDRSIWNKASN